MWFIVAGSLVGFWYFFGAELPHWWIVYGHLVRI